MRSVSVTSDVTPSRRDVLDMRQQVHQPVIGVVKLAANTSC
jgi:hypothetical protein